MGLQITDTTLRDAHQSLIATRMRTRDMVPIAEKLDKVGFFSIEMWGGATFDACLRFLNEDPWERLRVLRSKIKNTRLQMLLRGQNIVGYRHYADDVLKEFIRLAVKNGIDVFRVFDALNDVRNMELAIKVAKEHGAHVQGAMCYTTSPVHTIDSFAKMAATLEGLGCDSICIKDMAGLISPMAANDLVKAIKKKVKIPLDLHSHCSSGMAPLSYYAAVLAGADIVDTTFSPLSWGTSQPPTESIVAAFKDTPYDSGLNLDQLYEIGEYFAALVENYRTLFTAEATRPNVSVLLHQIPGGMLSNLVSQLKEQNALDRLEEVELEVPRVRQDLGYPPLVTPTSQLVGTQAVLNVLAGVRYKRVTQEVKNYFLGQYGRPPAEVNEEIKKAVIGDEKPITVRPADIIKPELEKLKADGKKLGILNSEEDLITYALYPQVAMKFLKGEAKEESVPAAAAPAVPPPHEAGPAEFSVDVDGEIFNVKIAPVVGKTIEVARSEKPKGSSPGAVVSPMAGMVLAVKVKVGDRVKAGDILLMIEAMKMHNEVDAPHNGVVKEIMSFEGEVVNSGDVLMVLELS
ncbi:MAG: sodium-extruding oxaloacetate decarboxylase subunit alpha [Dehalococcoidales bacterium]|nr:sodium-extruding oxaloacetate decarboxylase subunit alpha [Dehalococcoidales bacterium]